MKSRREKYLLEKIQELQTRIDTDGWIIKKLSHNRSRAVSVVSKGLSSLVESLCDLIERLLPVSEMDEKTFTLVGAGRAIISKRPRVGKIVSGRMRYDY